MSLKKNVLGSCPDARERFYDVYFDLKTFSSGPRIASILRGSWRDSRAVNELAVKRKEKFENVVVCVSLCHAPNPKASNFILFSFYCLSLVNEHE